MNTSIEQQPDDDSINLGEIAAVLLGKWKRLLGASLAAGALGYAGSFLIKPTFTAKATFISPQQQQNSASAALASLGALSGIAGAAAGIKSPADQYVALMQSVTISDRIIDRFSLMDVYESKFRVDAQKALATNVRINAGKKNNLITVEADDTDPKRAADMANAYIDELKTLSNGLALTEAQQRRKFFENHLGKAKDALKAAQLALQKTGFTAGALRNEPKAAAEAYARVKAELAAAEVKLSALRAKLADQAPELQQHLALIGQLQNQLDKMEQPLLSSGDQDYISAYREYKYQEALFDVYSRQFEIAKMDEAREGTLIQVLDDATTPERKSKPKRSTISIAAFLLTFLALSMSVMIRFFRTKDAKKEC